MKLKRLSSMVLLLLLVPAIQASGADDLLNRLGELPGINVTQVNETAVQPLQGRQGRDFRGINPS